MISTLLLTTFLTVYYIMSQQNNASPLKKYWFALKTLKLPLLLRSARYSLEKTYAELKFADPFNPQGGLKILGQAIKKSAKRFPDIPPFSKFSGPGAVQEWRQNDNRVVIVCERGALQITAVSPQMIQVRLNEQDIFSTPFSYAIEKPTFEWEKPVLTVTETDNHLILKTEALTIEVERNNGHIHFLTTEEEPINADKGGVGRHGNWVALQRDLPPNSPVFGLGGRAEPLNLRGKRYLTWNRDPGGNFSTGDDPLYQSHPWFISLNQGRAFGFLFDNSYFGQFDMGQTEAEAFTVNAADGELRYYFIYGPEIKLVLTRLAKLTGKMPLPPLWALGLHQSKWSYKNEKQLREIARQYRRREIPCDVLHLDIDHMQNKRIFTWHKRRFPQPAEMIKDLRQAGFRLINIIDPGIKADRLNPLAEAGLKENVFVKYPDGKVFKGPVWPGDSYFPDFTNPTVRVWWAEQCRPLLDDGVAGLWTDMNEPSVFGYGDGTMPNIISHNFENHQASHAQMHNVYGMQMARATYKAQQALRPNKRPFVLSRAGFSGIQRYAAVWTGDNESSWEHLGLSLSMVLNLGLSGVPFAGPDVGGFQGQASPELFARWIQLASLFPLFRIHSANFSPPQEPWVFGPRVETIARQTIELRYRLLPALYTAMWQASQSGLPVIRPLFLNFQADEKTHTIEDQFMMGDSILVAPVLGEGETTRAVYLPYGPNWYNYHTGECLAGGQSISVPAPLDSLPIFIKGGSVLPHWPQIQHTNQAKTLDSLHLHLYVGPGKSELYEDEGDGPAYRNGHYNHTQFTCQPEENRLILTARRKGQYVPGYQIIAWTIFNSQTINPQTILADSLQVSKWHQGATPNSIAFIAPMLQRLEITF